MGFKLLHRSPAGPIEKRWFKGTIVFSVAAALAFYGRVAFILWGKDELGKRTLTAGSDERMVGSAHEFLQQLRVGELIGWVLLIICCAGFLICGGMWFRTSHLRHRTRRKL